MNACKCQNIDSNVNQFEVCPLGADKLHGDVTIWTCKDCGECWLHYLVEYHFQTASLCWFRGPIEKREINNINAETALSRLAKLDWYFYGGSKFAGSGRASGPAPARLFDYFTENRNTIHYFAPVNAAVSA